MQTQKLILKNFQSPGDTLMLTAAVRDLHLAYPGQYLTDVRTPSPDLWLHNPWLTPLSEQDPEVRVLDCEYPLINESNQRPIHFLEGFTDDLNRKLGLNIRTTAFRADIHLTEAEKQFPEHIRSLVGDTPFWIIDAGGKFDFTIKWWSFLRYQEVVNALRQEVRFVQVGAAGHEHAPLEGVVNLVGKTSLRDLVRLMYHAEGVLTPVSFPMHLTAALPMESGGLRPCVVIAGGREPVSWEAYPGHQFLHTIGMLPCCEKGGCWRSRTMALGDGTPMDEPDRLCLDVRGDLPACMNMITVQDVVTAIRKYLPEESTSHRMGRKVSPNWVNSVERQTAELTESTAADSMDTCIAAIPPYPDQFRGRGIVINGGGIRYFTCAWVCIRMLRRAGCRLPIELWYLGADEMDYRMKALMQELDVTCIDAVEMSRHKPIRRLGGWELKAYALVHSRFQEILFLDADNVPLVNPEFLFDTPQYQDTGAVFWPDYPDTNPKHPIWEITRTPFRAMPEFESGQIVIHKQKHWRSLQLALWLNAHSDFFYRYILGDKDTFLIALLRLEMPFSMPSKRIHALDATMCQHDFEGNRIFQHRNLAKWKLFGENKRIDGFYFEKTCLAYLDELRGYWDGTILKTGILPTHAPQSLKSVMDELVKGTFEFLEKGNIAGMIQFRANGTVLNSARTGFRYWRLDASSQGVMLEMDGVNRASCTLIRRSQGLWADVYGHTGMRPVEGVRFSAGSFLRTAPNLLQVLAEMVPDENLLTRTLLAYSLTDSGEYSWGLSLGMDWQLAAGICLKLNPDGDPKQKVVMLPNPEGKYIPDTIQGGLSSGPMSVFKYLREMQVSDKIQFVADDFRAFSHRWERTLQGQGIITLSAGLSESFVRSLLDFLVTQGVNCMLVMPLGMQELEACLPVAAQVQVMHCGEHQSILRIQ